MDYTPPKLITPHIPGLRKVRDTVDVRHIRRRLGITQRQFAGWFGFPVATLRHWERGNRKPKGAARVLLCVIADNPRSVLVAVRKARLRFPGTLAGTEQLESYRAPPGYGEPRIPIFRRDRWLASRKSRAPSACASPRTRGCRPRGAA